MWHGFRRVERRFPQSGMEPPTSSLRFGHLSMSYGSLGSSRTTKHFRGTYRIQGETETMSTCNQLDLETRGSQVIVRENLPGH